MSFSDAILTVAQMRAAEQAIFATGIAEYAVMEQAGKACAEAIWRRFGPQQTLILCGPGNNGGDGYVIARYLQSYGAPVRVAALAEPRTESAKQALRDWAGPVEDMMSCDSATLLVDAIFGVGMTRSLDDGLATRLADLQGVARETVAIDVPSGVDSDTGALLGAQKSWHTTIAIGACKPAHCLMPAAAFCGDVIVADIGLATEERIASLIGKPMLTAPDYRSHKYTRGKVLVVAGAMPGAAMLAAHAAQRSGAGYVALSARASDMPQPPYALVHHSAPLQKLLEDKRTGAIVVGPGLGRDDQARSKLRLALEADIPLVLDADAISLVGSNAACIFNRRHQPKILTPHEGEFARAFGDCAGSKIERAQQAARATNAVIILKGADTVIADAQGNVAISRPLPHWLATAGTGDVLAGIAGTMLARGLSAFEAAKTAVWLHGQAALWAGPYLIADDLLDHLSRAVSDCTETYA